MCVHVSVCAGVAHVWRKEAGGESAVTVERAQCRRADPEGERLAIGVPGRVKPHAPCLSDRVRTLRSLTPVHTCRHAHTRTCTMILRSARFVQFPILLS